MAEPADHATIIREAVGSFADREHFRRAVGDLVAAGFPPGDLSVLAAHEPLAIAGDLSVEPKEVHRWLPAGLADEIKWLGPLTVAGIILLSAGPVAASVAALIGAGLGGAALKELLDRYAAAHHSEAFAAALHAGAVLLWVRCEDDAHELRATRLLEEAGGRHVHIHGRQVGKN